MKTSNNKSDDETLRQEAEEIFRFIILIDLLYYSSFGVKRMP
jgi:hypothetical protein